MLAIRQHFINDSFVINVIIITAQNIDKTPSINHIHTTDAAVNKNWC